MIQVINLQKRTPKQPMIVDTIVHKKKVIVKQVYIINELYLYKCFIFFQIKKKIFF